MTPPEITLSDFGNTQVTYKQALEAHHKLNTNERVSNLKGSNPNNDVPRKIAALENLSPEQKTNLTDNFGGRTRVHLLRMFNPERSEAEHKFAFACLEHLPNYFEKLKGEAGLPWKKLLLFSFSVPFILGLDDFAGYVPLFSIIKVFGFAIGVLLAHTLLNIALFLNPEFTIKIVKNQWVSFFGTLAFVGLALWGLLEVVKIFFK